MRDLIEGGQADALRKRLKEATQSMLGSTIALSDDEWLAPSLLPGWTRAHVATHVARNADALASIAQGALDGHAPAEPTPAARRLSDLEQGSERSGLELQIDLDTSAGSLDRVLDQVLNWTTPVRLSRVGMRPMAAIPAARFHEVYLHHVDLDCGFTPDEIDPVPGSWLLSWLLIVLGADPAGMPDVEVVSESGITALLGAGEERRLVRGQDVDLWHWLSGRGDGSRLDGAEDITWPLIG